MAMPPFPGLHDVKKRLENKQKLGRLTPQEADLLKELEEILAKNPEIKKAIFEAERFSNYGPASDKCRCCGRDF